MTAQSHELLQDEDRSDFLHRPPSRTLEQSNGSNDAPVPLFSTYSAPLAARTMGGDSIDEFLYVHGWFDRYGSTPGGYRHILGLAVDWLLRRSPLPTRDDLGERFHTTKMALNWFLQHEGKNIVETGSLREPGRWRGVGCSTYLFGEVAARYDGHLWTCDMSERVIATARQETRRFAGSITYVCSDSVAFLHEFNGRIDLLYLDSMDCPRIGDETLAQQHNLRELMAALPKLAERAVVLLDDNHFSNGGKARLTKQYLRDQGWICLYDWRQSLWTRR